MAAGCAVRIAETCSEMVSGDRSIMDLVLGCGVGEVFCGFAP